MSRASIAAHLTAAAFCTALFGGGALAEGTQTADPVVAKVDGQAIHLSDLKDAIQATARERARHAAPRRCIRCCSIR